MRHVHREHELGLRAPVRAGEHAARDDAPLDHELGAVDQTLQVEREGGARGRGAGQRYERRPQEGEGTFQHRKAGGEAREDTPSDGGPGRA
jgi:hypothetical protein